MRISRKGYRRNHGETIAPSTDNHGFHLDLYPNGKMAVVFYAQEGNSQYEYRMYLTADELEDIFLRPLSGLSDSERGMWRTLFDLWKKRAAERIES